MNVTEHTITLHGKKALYWKHESAKKGTIVFLHGFPGNHQGLMDLATELAKYYTIIMPDLPGCGK